MDAANPLLWLAWALFGSFLGWLAWSRYRPLVLQSPAAPEALPPAAGAPPAWLFCEEGTPLDRRVQWFPLRAGGRTVAGHRPRAATEETQYLYLAADDIQDEHALIRFEPRTGRYELHTLGSGPVLHNNEPLAPGETAELVDGDTLEFGQVSRFRFTLTGPEAP